MSQELSRLSELPSSVQRRILGFVADDLAGIGGASPEPSSLTRHGEGHCQGRMEDLVQRGYFVHDNLLPFDAGLLNEVRQEAEACLTESSKPGVMGGTSDKWTCGKARGDTIRWLNIETEEKAGRVGLARLMNCMVALRTAIQDLGFNVGGKPLFQLACYSEEGARYVRHADASASSPDRVVTAICYLNGAPHEDAGGHLCLYPNSSSLTSQHGVDKSVLVTPAPGRIIIFQSKLEHEVLPCFFQRYALTVWFKSEEGRFLEQQRVFQNPPSLGRPVSKIGLRPSSGTGRIFVSIASYRDPECPWTIANLFRHADEPELVQVGVVWQYKPGSDDALMGFSSDLKWAANVREIRIPYHEATGPCKARKLGQSLWNGEEYWLQIDAHMQCLPGWDTRLKTMLCQAEEQSEFAKAVISSYPPDYEGTGPVDVFPTQNLPVVLCAERFDDQGMLRLTGKMMSQPFCKPLRSLFWAAGFSFARSKLFEEVPYIDLPHLFFGEELFMLLRMWTAGWDVFAPNDIIFFHQWSRLTRPTVWKDGWIDNGLKRKSQEFVKNWLEKGHSDIVPGVQSPMVIHLGTIRSIDDFGGHCGVHFREKKISERGLLGGFCADDFAPARTIDDPPND